MKPSSIFLASVILLAGLAQAKEVSKEGPKKQGKGTVSSILNCDFISEFINTFVFALLLQSRLGFPVVSHLARDET